MENIDSQKIISKLEENRIKDAHFSRFVRDLISNLKDKQQEVIVKRFGLSGRRKTTLDAIGKNFGVTRERVRQIESASLNKLKKLSVLDHNRPTFKKIKNIIESKGGVIDEESLVRELILDLDEGRIEEIRKTLYFLLLLNDELEFVDDSDHTNRGWVLKKHKKETIGEIAKIYAEILDARKEIMEDEALLLELLKNEKGAKLKESISPEFFISAINMSKKLHKTEDGKRGLVNWPWVKPRTIRDKIFYVLSRKGEPMHFSEIAQAIEKAGFDSKKATLQTIHNELISDERFVLVGRGLYGLNSWGYEPGTVEEVIEKVLIEKGVLSQNDIVEEVMKKKRVKKATILINLQSSNKFKKTPEGYILNK